MNKKPKKIGEGYFYTVYDLGNGRVVKRIKNKMQRLFYIARVNGFFIPFVWKEYRNAQKVSQSIPHTNKEVQERIAEQRLVGNPRWINDVEYEQDAVLTVLNALHQHREYSYAVDLIEHYIGLIHRLWEYGCHEKVFNFTLNCGIDAQGTIVLIDFNELSFDPADAEADIRRETWLYRWSYRHLPSAAQPYYKKRMKEEMTEDQLHALWGKRLSGMKVMNG